MNWHRVLFGFFFNIIYTILYMFFAVCCGMVNFMSPKTSRKVMHNGRGERRHGTRRRIHTHLHPTTRALSDPILFPCAKLLSVSLRAAQARIRWPAAARARAGASRNERHSSMRLTAADDPSRERLD